MFLDFLLIIFIDYFYLLFILRYFNFDTMSDIEIKQNIKS